MKILDSSKKNFDKTLNKLIYKRKKRIQSNFVSVINISPEDEGLLIISNIVT